MTSWERLRLGPFQKWKLYGLPPWKFFVNILLILGTTASIYIISDTVTPYTRAQKENWNSILVPSSLDEETTVYGATEAYYIYTIDEFIKTLQKFVYKYYNLPSSVVGNFRYIESDEFSIGYMPVTMKLSVYKDAKEMFNPTDNDFDTNSIETRMIYFIISVLLCVACIYPCTT